LYQPAEVHKTMANSETSSNDIRVFTIILMLASVLFVQFV